MQMLVKNTVLLLLSLFLLRVPKEGPLDEWMNGWMEVLDK